MLGADGHIYGTTQGGSTSGGEPASGSIFRYRIAQSEGESDVLELLYIFSDALPLPARNNTYLVNGVPIASSENRGANVEGHSVSGLVATSDGGFIGTTRRGGSHGWGTLFRFLPGNEVSPGSALTPVTPQVLLTIGGLNVGEQHAVLAVGTQTRFSWRGVYAAGCVASSTEPDSTWAGPRPQQAVNLDETETIVASKVGTWRYTLTCLPQSSVSTDPVSATVTVEVVTARLEPKDMGNGGGGGLSLPGLLLAGGAAWRLRRRARHPGDMQAVKA